MEPTHPSPLGRAALVYAVACVLALLVFSRAQAPLVRFGSPHPGAVLLGRDPLEGLLWGLGLGAILAGSSQAISRWTPWGRRLSRLLARVLGALHPVDALLLSALSSFAEEVIFRGVILPYLGLVVSSILFGLAHVIPRKGLWPWSLWALLAGLCLGWTALATKGLLAPILAHFVVNTVGLLLLAERPD